MLPCSDLQKLIGGDSYRRFESASVHHLAVLDAWGFGGLASRDGTR